MIVVDTNPLVYLLLPTAHTVQADAVLLKDPDWVAPALIHSEFRNVLLGAVRRKKVEADDARVLLDRATEVITVPDGGVGRPGSTVPGAGERMQRLRLRIRVACPRSACALGHSRSAGVRRLSGYRRAWRSIPCQ